MTGAQAKAVDDLAYVAIALTAPTLIAAMALAAREEPDPRDLAALVLSAGLTLAGRTAIDAIGLPELLATADRCHLAGDRLAAAANLVRGALRARELADVATLGAVWRRALAWQ